MRFPHVQYCGATEQEKSSESYLCWRDRLPSTFAELYLKTRHSTSDAVTELWIIHHSLLCIYWNLRDQMERFAYESYRQFERKHNASGNKMLGSYEPSVSQSHSGLIRSFTGSLSKLLRFPSGATGKMCICIEATATCCHLVHFCPLLIFYWGFQVTHQDRGSGMVTKTKLKAHKSFSTGDWQDQWAGFWSLNLSLFAVIHWNSAMHV